MALKVVIVDDNAATVDTLLSSIDWRELDCQVVDTAGDGADGARLILEHKPDIVLTNIRMPGPSGLEMIGEVRQAVPNCKMIILTCMNEFQYASRAIKLGVFDYILKPVDPEEVTRSLRRAVAASRQEDPQALLFKRRAQMLSLLTNDGQRGQGVHDMLTDVGVKFLSYYVMVVQLQQGYAYAQAMLNRVDAVLEWRQAEATTVFLYDAVVIFVARQEPGDGWREQAVLLAEDIREELAAPLYIGVSGLGTSPHAIRAAYQQARSALWEIALSKDGRYCCFYSEGSQEASGERTAEAHRRLGELIEKADLSDASADEAAQVLLEQSGQQYSNLRAMVSLYAMALCRKFPCTEIRKTDAALHETWFVGNGEDVKECLRRICRVLRENRSAQESNAQSLLTRNALQYIRLHAVERLSLNSVAEKFRVSPNYLSALIRKETGVTFHEHILAARMEAACAMLADPRIRVEEVATAAGYSNYISFYNAFKRMKHITPTEYRNSIAR